VSYFWEVLTQQKESSMAKKAPLNLITVFFSKMLRWLSFTKISINQPDRGILARFREWRKARNYDSSVKGPPRKYIVRYLKEVRFNLQDAKNEFEAMQQCFNTQAVTTVSGMEQTQYRLNRQYERCHLSAHALNQRMNAIKSVSWALFAEWDHELNGYANQALRGSSKRQLTAVRRSYTHLIKMMQKTDHKMWPILIVFHDKVLYCKHNTNTWTIGTSQHEVIEISIDISQFILAVDQTITETNQFISALTDQKVLPDH